MRTYELPDASDEVTFDEGVNNSYGRRGCFRVGSTEIEEPVEDVKWAAQYLADALAALDYQNATMIDRVAAKARAAYHHGSETVNDFDSTTLWAAMSDDYRDKWRAVVRAVIEHA